MFITCMGGGTRAHRQEECPLVAVGVYWVLTKRPILTERRNVLCFFCNFGEASRGGRTGPAEYSDTTAAPAGGAKSIQKHCHKISHGVVFIIFIVILVKKKKKEKKFQRRKKRLQY